MVLNLSDNLYAFSFPPSSAWTLKGILHLASKSFLSFSTKYLLSISITLCKIEKEWNTYNRILYFLDFWLSPSEYFFCWKVWYRKEGKFPRSKFSSSQFFSRIYSNGHKIQNLGTKRSSIQINSVFGCPVFRCPVFECLL